MSLSISDALKVDATPTYRPKTPLVPSRGPSRPSSPMPRSRAVTPKLISLDKIPISLLKDQSEIELKPRRSSTDRRSSLEFKEQDEAVTITAVVVKRAEHTEKPHPERAQLERSQSERPQFERLQLERSQPERLQPTRPQSSLKRIDFEKKRRKSESAERRTEEIEEEVVVKRKKSSSDNYCWRCHRDDVEANCSACPRSWHRKCIGGTQPNSRTDNWICGECASILRAENASTRSPLMANLTVDQLCMVLKYMVGKMKQVPGATPFLKPVEPKEVPNYIDYIIKPMDLSTLESNVLAKVYGSTDAFMADAKWILHNCIVFNTCGGTYTDSSKLTTVAKQLIKIARQEVSDLEACSNCYIKGRHLPRPHYTWFVEACQPPHPLIWAKLKGFPFWPAKAMPRTNNQGHVDVRFFGEHDRAWVSPKDLFLYSKEPPTPIPRKRKCEMFDCLREISIHIKRLTEAFGSFEFAPPRTAYNAHDPLQIKLLLPQYEPAVPIDYLLPRKVPVGRMSRKKVVDSPTDSISEANAESDVEMISETNSELRTVMRKPRKVLAQPKITEIFTKNLPNDLLPQKIPRQCRVMRKTTVKETPVVKRVLAIKGRTRGQPLKGKRTVGVKGTVTRVYRRRARVLDKPDDEGKNVSKESNPVRTRRASEDSLKSGADLKDEPKEEEPLVEKKQSRAKKSFPNKPPQVVSSVPLQQRMSAESTSAFPTKEELYQIPTVEAGPLSGLLRRGADDLAKQMALIIEESIKEAAQGKGTLVGTVDPQQASVYITKLRIERMRWQHEQAIIELKNNTERTLMDMRATLEAERLRAIEEISKSAEEEKNRCIEETKGKQWCACCGNEAFLYCCWNTSYCTESCQELHWRTHYSKCKRLTAASTSGEGGSINGPKEPMESMPKLLTAQHNFANVRGA